MNMFPHHSSITLSLPPYAKWSPIFRWIDRWERRVYRVEGERIRMWLPRHVGEGFLEIYPMSETELQLELDHEAGISESAVTSFCASWWDLDRDLSPFYKAYSDDPVLSDSIRQNEGARIVGFPDVFEALSIGILGQQVNVKFAYTLKERLTEAFGDSMEWKGEHWHRFPHPEQLLTATVEDLRKMQVSTRKAEYLLGVAEAIQSGVVDREHLLTIPFEEQMEILTSLRGIGSWTAQYVAMKCLHGMSAFPAGDAGLQNAGKTTLGLGRKATVEELLELAKAWKGWEAYAAWFLWMS